MDPWARTCSCRRWRGVLKDVERGEGWLGHRRGSSSGPSAPGSCIQLCMPTDLERDGGGETCRYCRNKSTPFTILRVTSYRMIHCTDSRSGEAMLYRTTKSHAWLGNVLLGMLLTILTLRELFFWEENPILQYFQHLLICAGLSVQRGTNI